MQPRYLLTSRSVCYSFLKGMSGFRHRDVRVLVEGLVEIGMPDGVCEPLKAILDGSVGVVFGDGDSYSIPDTVEHYEPGDYPPSYPPTIVSQCF